MWKLSLRRYRSLLKCKRSSFWQSKLEQQRHNARQLWHSFDALMGRGRAPPAASLSPEALLEFFLKKVSSTRVDHDDAHVPSFSIAPENCRFLNFRTLSENDVIPFLQRLPHKTSECDPLPTYLLKCCSDLFATFLTHLFNRSLSEGVFPSSWK